jgi:predicted SAM-dependent methyltransferase
MGNSETIKINLGCGPDGIEGWVNYDWGWLPFISRYQWLLKILIKIKILNKNYLKVWPETTLQDLREGIPQKDNSADWIYCSNFFEHLEKYQTENLLEECYRILKNVGSLRIVMPNVRKIVNEYLKTNNADKFCSEFYGFDKNVTQKGFKSWLYRIAIRGHLWMYDEESIMDLLKNVGFKRITKSEFRKSKMPDVKKLDLAVHQKLGMYIEASKT